ncbi:MAG: hypothetical protein N2Z80_06515 [Hydrogenothermaceae bacterium]|nr:hypothetical protein [Hydrogenothermaceae bacterium]
MKLNFKGFNEINSSGAKIHTLTSREKEERHKDWNSKKYIFELITKPANSSQGRVDILRELQQELKKVHFKKIKTNSTNR